MRKHIVRIAILVAIVAAVLLFWQTRPDHARLSVADVSGRLPKITAPRTHFFPTVNVAKAEPWPAGKTPTAAPGLKVEAFAKGLDHPRWLYVLPNGDVLVAETNAPPDQDSGITAWFEHRLMKKAG